MDQVSLRRDEERQIKIEKHRHILDWLSPILPEANFKRACSLRHQGTGEWLLEEPQFKRWLAGETNFLWIHGVPGSGKTVLSSNIIAELERLQDVARKDPPFAVAYHFLDFKDDRSQDPATVFGTLVKQLYLELPSPEMHPSIQSLYHLSYNKTTGQAEKPSWEDLVELLTEISVSFPRILLIIDALDEALQELQEKVFCPTLRHTALQKGLRIATLVTSRNEVVMEHAFRGLPDIDLEVDRMSPDIARYVEAEVRRRPSLAALDVATREQVIRRVVKGAHGMQVNTTLRSYVTRSD